MTQYTLKSLNNKLTIKSDDFMQMKVLLLPLFDEYIDSYELTVKSDNIKQTLGISVISETTTLVCDIATKKATTVSTAEDALIVLTRYIRFK